jgi:hypothetical protein
VTGPGEGKIPLKARVLVGSCELSCDVYLHVKGYSRARVTHVDVECDELNEALPPGAHAYATAYTKSRELRVRFREPLKAFGYARELVIMCPELAAVLAPMRDTVYVGGKEGGIFIGFRREQIRKLEAFASSLGVSPRSNRDLSG